MMGTAAPLATWFLLALSIPTIGVNAPIVPVDVFPSGYMEPPPDAYTIGAYRISDHNIILAGHVDWNGPAVFSRLYELQPGDLITLRQSPDDSPASPSEEAYIVKSSQLYLADDIPDAAYFPEDNAAVQSITLITCGGVFAHDEYQSRRLVHAELSLPHD